MNIVWFLIFTTPAGYVPVVLPTTFQTLQACRTAVADLEQNSRAKEGMKNLYGICISGPKPTNGS